MASQSPLSLSPPCESRRWLFLSLSLSGLRARRDLAAATRGATRCVISQCGSDAMPCLAPNHRPPSACTPCDATPMALALAARWRCHCAPSVSCLLRVRGEKPGRREEREGGKGWGLIYEVENREWCSGVGECGPRRNSSRRGKDGRGASQSSAGWTYRSA